MIEVKSILEKYLNTEEKINLFDTWYSLIEEIIIHPEFQKRKFMEHHENLSVFKHCVLVSFKSYLRALKKGCSDMEIKNTAVASLLHDFYTHAWRYSDSLLTIGSPYYDYVYPKVINSPLFQKHGFTHATEALENAKTYFPHLINEYVEDAILWHMFPLTKPLFKAPKYVEGRILTVVDKTSSYNKIPNLREISKLLGIRTK